MTEARNGIPLASVATAAAALAWLVVAAFAEGLPIVDQAFAAAFPSRALDLAVAVSVVTLFWWVAIRHGALTGPLGIAAAAIGLLALASGAFPALVALAVLILPGLLIGSAFSSSVESPAARLALGLGILAGGVGWVLPLPVFHAPALLLVVGVASWLGRDRLKREWAAWVSDDAQGAEGTNSRAASWIWVVAVVIASLPAWLPLRNSDDLSLRIGLAHELMEFAHARFDVGTQVWALSPWNSEILHALVALFAGGEASGPLSALWVVLAAWLIRGIALRLGARPAAALVAGALYASLPVTAFLAGGLQTEAMSAVFVAALALVLLQHEEHPPGRALLAVALLAGALMGIKVSNALLLLPMGAWMLFRWGRTMPWRMMPMSALAGVLVGGASYAYAATLTGNPVLPLFNAWFQSPWFDATNFVDETWQNGLSWTLPWRLLVDSGRYFEGHAGVAGLSSVFMLALVPAALYAPRVRAVAAVGLAGCLLVLWQVQYLRYFHPGLVLILPALMAAFPSQAWAWRSGVVFGLVQLVLLPTASFMFVQGILRDRVLLGASMVEERYVPEKPLLRDFRVLAGSSDRVLLVDPVRPYVALLPGRVVGVNWHNPHINRLRSLQVQSADAWKRILRETGASHVIALQDGIPPAVAEALAAFGATTISRRGHLQLMVLQELPQAPIEVEVSGNPSSIRYSATLDAGHAGVGSISISARCSIPGQPIVAAWSIFRGGAPALQQWEWLPCPYSGVIDVQRDIQWPAGTADGVAAVLSPARPESGIELAPIGQGLRVRRDLIGETTLVDALVPLECRGARCAPIGPSISDRPVRAEVSP